MSKNKKKKSTSDKVDFHIVIIKLLTAIFDLIKVIINQFSR